MIEDQLRDRLHATAEHIDRSPVPLGPIRTAGRTMARRRTGARVAIGLAATAAAVTTLALTLPRTGLSTDGLPPATDSSQPSEPCATGLLDVGVADLAVCVDPLRSIPPWPGPEGLQKVLATELLAAGPAQRKAFADDRVTEPEYRAGFERYRACLADRGYQLGSVRDTELGYDFVVSGEAVDSGADRACYEQHYRALDIAWQIPISQRTSELLLSVNTCLVNAGAKPTADLDRAAELLRDAGLSEADCGLTPGQLGSAGE